MHGIAIELQTQCAGCGQPLPLNACAEQITCGGCSRVTALDDGRWRSLLEDCVDEVGDLQPGEGMNRTIMTGAATYQLMFGNQEPRCGACKTAVPDAAAELAPRGFTMCVGCGQRISLRAAPAALAALGVQLVVGEDADQLPGGHGGAAPAAPAPVMLYCPQCQAPLSVDGSARMVRCQYCSGDVYLPDPVWARLHPVKQVARWYLGLGKKSDAAARAITRFKWYGIADAVIDANKFIYCVGEDDDSKFSVWCLGPDLVPRWVNKTLDLDDDNAGITLDPRGRLWVWQGGKHSLVRLDARDGSVIDRLGGREPDGAHVHHLDLDDCKDLRADVDGTILALMGEHLVRYAEDGSGIPTWPARKGLFGSRQDSPKPLYAAGHQLVDVDGAYVEHVGNHPTALDDYTNLVYGWDGHLYAERSEFVACFDRTGKRVWRVKLPIDNLSGHWLGVDGAGQVHALGTLQGDPRTRVLVRVSADGSRVDTIATDHLNGGVLGGEELLLVAPDGTIYLLRYGMRIRVLAPDGRLLYQSEKSVAEDADERAARDRRA
ncbi:MAG TPA: hypothetical protein VHE35_20375 [Kofleriaceae bacterium]|nr:hypothetical protein [Kofleriaceae bacterium]